MKKYFVNNEKVPNSAIAENGTLFRIKKSRTKKALGQNFLKSESALRKIIEAGEIKKDDVILEIGPGRGALTSKLLEYAGVVVAIEKDRELFEFLKIKFAKDIKAHTLILVCEDILKLDDSYAVLVFANGLAGIGTQRTEDLSKNSKPRSYKIIANIPYNITGAILKKFLTAKNQPERMVLLVQNEVGKRIAARDGKESILSISVKAYGEPKIVMKVPARYFSPSPKVDSAIISIKNISRRIFEEHGINEEEFWKIVKAGFAHKRKKLSSNLKNYTGENYTGEPCVNLGNKRAEDSSLADWIALASSFSR